MVTRCQVVCVCSDFNLNSSVHCNYRYVVIKKEVADSSSDVLFLLTGPLFDAPLKTNAVSSWTQIVKTCDDKQWMLTKIQVILLNIYVYLLIYFR